LKEHNRFVKSEEEQSAIFVQRFFRSYGLLHFIACRVLADECRVHIAERNCWRTAARNPPHFQYEGGFRRWLVRVLIDEALAILCQTKERAMRPPVSWTRFRCPTARKKQGVGNEKRECTETSSIHAPDHFNVGDRPLVLAVNAW